MSARRFIASGSRGAIATKVCSPGRCASTIPAGLTPTKRRAREKNSTGCSSSFPSRSFTVAVSSAVSPTSRVRRAGSTTSSAGSCAAAAAPAKSSAASEVATARPTGGAGREGRDGAGCESRRRPAENEGDTRCSNMIGRSLLMSPARRGTGDSIPPARSGPPRLLRPSPPRRRGEHRTGGGEGRRAPSASSVTASGVGVPSRGAAPGAFAPPFRPVRVAPGRGPSSGYSEIERAQNQRLGMPNVERGAVPFRRSVPFRPVARVPGSRSGGGDAPTDLVAVRVTPRRRRCSGYSEIERSQNQ